MLQVRITKRKAVVRTLCRTHTVCKPKSSTPLRDGLSGMMQDRLPSDAADWVAIPAQVGIPGCHLQLWGLLLLRRDSRLPPQALGRSMWSPPRGATQPLEVLCLPPPLSAAPLPASGEHTAALSAPALLVGGDAGPPSRPSVSAVCAHHATGMHGCHMARARPRKPAKVTSSALQG